MQPKRKINKKILLRAEVLQQRTSLQYISGLRLRLSKRREIELLRRCTKLTESGPRYKGWGELQRKET